MHIRVQNEQQFSIGHHICDGLWWHTQWYTEWFYSQNEWQWYIEPLSFSFIGFCLFVIHLIPILRVYKMYLYVSYISGMNKFVRCLIFQTAIAQINYAISFSLHLEATPSHCLAERVQMQLGMKIKHIRIRVESRYFRRYGFDVCSTRSKQIKIVFTITSMGNMHQNNFSLKK